MDLNYYPTKERKNMNAPTHVLSSYNRSFRNSTGEPSLVIHINFDKNSNFQVVTSDLYFHILINKIGRYLILKRDFTQTNAEAVARGGEQFFYRKSK